MCSPNILLVISIEATLWLKIREQQSRRGLFPFLSFLFLLEYPVSTSEEEKDTQLILTDISNLTMILNRFQQLTRLYVTAWHFYMWGFYIFFYFSILF